MPTYTYQCQKCAHMIDAHRKIAERDNPPPSCENCRHKDLKRIMATSNFSFTDGGHKGEYTKTGPRK